MKKLLVLTLLFGPLYLFSQSNYDIETGPLVPVKFNWISTYFGESGGNYYFSVKQLNKHKYSVFAFDRDLSLEKSEQIKPDYKLFTYGYSGSATYGFTNTSLENNNLVYIRPEFKANKMTSGIETLYKESMDLNSLETNSESVALSQPMNVLRSKAKKDMGYIMEAESPAKSKRAFSMATANFTPENVEYQLITSDHHFNVLSESAIKPNMSAESFYREALAVNDDGTAYLLVSNRGDQEVIVEYILYQFSSNGDLANKITFIPEGYIYTKPVLNFDPEGSLILSGFTSTTDIYDADGIAYRKLNPEDLSPVIDKSYKLPAEFERASEAVKDGVLDKFWEPKSVVSSNGNFTITLEEAGLIGTESIETGDLFAVQFGPDGTIKNQAVLLKEQNSSGRYSRYTSYNLYSHDNQVFILYNDHIKNKDVPPTEEGIDVIMTGYNAMYKVDLTDSGFKRNLLYDSGKERFWTPLDQIYEIEDGVFIFCEESKKGIRLRRWTL